MSRQLQFDFQELPLIVQGDLQAGLINGSALINYWPDGVWAIGELYLDGFVPGHGLRFNRQSQLLERGTELHTTIFDRLTAGDWRQNVQDAVNNAIEEERAA